MDYYRRHAPAPITSSWFLFMSVLLLAFAITRLYMLLAQPVPALDQRGNKWGIGLGPTKCGIVTDTVYLPMVPDGPTFLYFDKNNARDNLRVVIWRKDREKFGKPELEYFGKSLCVTGEVGYHGYDPEIVVSSPEQVTENKGCC